MKFQNSIKSTFIQTSQIYVILKNFKEALEKYDAIYPNLNYDSNKYFILNSNYFETPKRQI